MFVSTFYSFKGGVGRTLALVNVAVELAKNGRRVLLVDFDLEAPGLDTFEKFAAPGPRLGVVDYVSDFIKNGQPPNVDAYAYEAPVSTDLQGDILVMPAGIRNSEYARKLAAIDWQSLYSDMDGFLLFEDLKDRWEEEFAPDYVPHRFQDGLHGSGWHLHATAARPGCDPFFPERAKPKRC